MDFIKNFVKFIGISQLQGLFEMVKVYTGQKSGTVLNSPGSCDYHETMN